MGPKMSDNQYKTFIFYFACVLFVLTGCSEAPGAQREDRPNVILILADDMGVGDLSFINGGITRTPNLDRLASESAWFDQAYSAAPVCAPARAALLTGRYPQETGCVTLGMARFPELTRISKTLPTVADIFAENGYATALVGKWHSGIGNGYYPWERGFQEFEGFMTFRMVSSYFDYTLSIGEERQSFSDRYLTRDLSERAIQFVKRNRDRPFFLHLAHYAPHRPLEAPEEYIQKYMAEGHGRKTATIYAMIEIMDEGIGDLLSTLDTLGIRDNTIVIFASDNGPDPLTGERFNRHLRGTKYTVYEGGIRVPFMVNWKSRIEPDTRSPVVHFTDVLPTLADVCGLDVPESVAFAGGSMGGILLGEKEDGLPERRFWQWNRGVPFYSHNAAMREGKWKLVRPYVTRDVPRGPSSQPPLLYNLEEDPYEENDVSTSNRRIVEDMSVRLEQWSREVEFARLGD